MNHYQTKGNSMSAEICYLSPKGHYYVAKGEPDTRYARYAHPINHSGVGKKPANLSQFELAKRASGE